MTSNTVVGACLLMMLASAAVTAQDNDIAFARMSRPGADGGPTEVKVGIYVVDISKIDDVNQSFTADFFVRMTWHDPRLADPSTSRIRTFGEAEIWTPMLVIFNKRRLFKTWPDVFRVDPQGNVLFRQRYFGALSAHYDLRDFPFDKRHVHIDLVTGNHGPEQVRIVSDERVTGRERPFTVVDSRLDDGEIIIGTAKFAPSGQGFASLTSRFGVQRNPAYFVWKVLLPLATIVFMSWVAFWIDPKQVGPALSVSTTSILTLIAYRFVLGGLTPRVSYLTRLDVFILGATMLVFLGLIATMITGTLATSNREEKARRIQRWCHWGFPVAFALLLLVFRI